MPVFWSSLIVIGLLLLVYLMIAGVPRPRGLLDSVGRRDPRLWLPMLGVFCAVAGVTGYLTQDQTRITGAGRWGLVGAAGFVGALLAAGFVHRIFAEPPSDPEDDPRYRFQGHVAQVTEAIGSDRPGRVLFVVDGQVFDFAAWSSDNTPVPRNAEVVIEQIDGDVATVEPWTSVEQRL